MDSRKKKTKIVRAQSEKITKRSVEGFEKAREREREELISEIRHFLSALCSLLNLGGYAERESSEVQLYFI